MAANLAANLPAVHSLPAPEDFEAIEAAVMETARGRWFLAEYARRMRAAETAKLLEAVTRIERTLRAAGQEHLQELHQEQPGALTGPEMGQAVAAVQERLSEIAWSLRERGFDERACAQIEAQARALRHLSETHGLISEDKAASEAPRMPASANRLAAADAAPVVETSDDGYEEASDDEMADRVDVAPVVMFPVEIEPRFTSLVAIDALEDRARAKLFY
jgi:hypothetical protein